VTFDKATATAFRQMAPDIELTVLELKGSIRDGLKSHLAAMQQNAPQGEFLSLVIPELLERRGIWEVLRRPGMHRLKASFLTVPGVQVIDIPISRDQVDPDTDETAESARNFVIVLVAGVHNATLQAIEYAETLSPSDLRAVSFGLDPGGTEKLAEEWLEYEIPVPLELHESPYRDIGQSLVAYIRRLEPDGHRRVVTVVIPEFVVPKAHHQLLHGQTALLVKRHLLFERGVVLASVPYHIKGGVEVERAT
jgi:hypothetical protein